MKIVADKIPLSELKSMAEGMFGDFVKAVVDVEKNIMAVGGELHADEEALLMENGSGQKHLWGINIYPRRDGAERVEFDSMINIKPSQDNRVRGVASPDIRRKILGITEKLIESK